MTAHINWISIVHLFHSPHLESFLKQQFKRKKENTLVKKEALFKHWSWGFSCNNSNNCRSNNLVITTILTIIKISNKIRIKESIIQEQLDSNTLKHTTHSSNNRCQRNRLRSRLITINEEVTNIFLRMKSRH